MSAAAAPVVLTGARGCLGRHVHQALAASGVCVRAIDRVPPRPGDQPGMTGDLRDGAFCRAALEAAGPLVHLACNGLDEAGAEADPRQDSQIFATAAAAGVRKIVFSSSIQVVVPDRLPMGRHSAVHPGNPYSVAKRAAEERLELLAARHGLQAVIFRFPGLTPGPVQFNPGHLRVHLREAFSYLTLADGADALIRAVRTDLPGCRIYLPASRRNVLDLPPPEVIRIHYPDVPLTVPAAAMHALIDLAPLADELGWEPRDAVGASTLPPLWKRVALGAQRLMDHRPNRRLQ